MPSIAPKCHSRRDAWTTDSWITPRWIIDEFGPFDLDPCACDPQPWPCASRQFTERDNGLLMPWPRGDMVWCNPPYGPALTHWLNRMANHNNGIALVFARTDTRAFHNSVWPFASGLLFFRGRVTFYRPDGQKSKAGHNSGGPSVLIAYGQVARQRLLDGYKRGAFVECPLARTILTKENR